MAKRNSLTEYEAKRQPGETPEPFGGPRPTGGSVFVIHHHWARQRHYDLRLEHGGVLWSWAVPKGPSVDPADKRFAAHVESHPVEYARFEGLIPAGNYGAGAMIIWDRGQWVPLNDPEAGFKKGKLLFELRGFKLHGKWTLVRIGKDDKNWLLIKEQDHWVGRIPEPPMDSVLSGLTVEQLKTGEDPSLQLRRALGRAKTPQAPVDPKSTKPMLCQSAEPFSHPDWLYEVKYDGYRVLASRDERGAVLRSRSGRVISDNFPEIVEALEALPHQHFLIDGEMTLPNAAGIPDFGRLQKRAQLARAHHIQHAALVSPASLFVFDLLSYQRFDLRALPLEKRKAYLRRILPSVGPLRYADHIDEHGEAAYAEAVRMQLEGLVAKRASSVYASTRSADWLKLAILKTDDFVVVGYLRPARGGSAFKALLLGQYENSEWVYVGRVGSGLDREPRLELARQLQLLHSAEPCLAMDSPPAGARWLKPQLVCEVRFKEFTAKGLLRQPVLLRLREDKPAQDCLHPVTRHQLGEPARVEKTTPIPQFIPINVNKVFWPAESLTKGQLLRHYEGIAKWMLPYLKDRPIVLTRYPDGIEGNSFFQHEAPQYLPTWIRTEAVIKRGEVTQRYIFIEHLDSLLYIINLGTIPIHLWNSRVQSIDHPDYCVLDIDPKSAPFTAVIQVARELHHICDSCDLPHYLKTSGGTGLHILIPLGGQIDHAQSRSLAELLARVCVARLPEIATIQRQVKMRKGRVYLDYLQNGFGKTIAAPFCVRPLAGAPVSMPLRWKDLKASTRPADFHILNAARRMRALKVDPMAPVLTEQANLHGALERLAAL